MSDRMLIYGVFGAMSVLGFVAFVQMYGFSGFSDLNRYLVAAGLMYGGIAASAAFFAAELLNVFLIKNAHEADNARLRRDTEQAIARAKAHIEANEQALADKHDKAQRALQTAQQRELEAQQTIEAARHEIARYQAKASAAEQKKYAAAGYAQRVERRMSKNTNE